jgi:hypothetical protein
VRWFVAAVFLRSGIAKASELTAFRSAVANYRLLPAAVERPVAVILPFAEILAAVLLAIGVAPGVVALALAFLLLVFATAIGISLARGRSFDCGCSGSVAPQTISWQHVAADVLLAALAALTAIAPPAAVRLWPGYTGSAQAVPSGSVTPLLLTVLIGLVVTAVLRRALSVRSLTVVVNGGRDAHPGLRALRILQAPRALRRH